MAGQRYTLTFDANLNVSQMKGALNQIQGALNGLKLPANIGRGFNDTFNKLTKEVQNFETITSKGINNATDLKALERSGEKVLSLYKQLQIQMKDLSKTSSLKDILPSSVAKQIKDGDDALKAYNKTVSDVDKQIKNASKSLQDWQDKLTARNQAVTNQQAVVDALKQQAKSVQELMQSNNLTLKQPINDIKDLEQAWKDAKQKVAEYQEAVKNGDRKPNKITEQGLNNLVTKIDATINAWKQQESAINQAEARLKQFTTSAENANKKIAEIQVTLSRLQNSAGADKATALQDLIKQLNSVGFDTSKITDLQSATQAVREFEAAQMQLAQQGVNQATNQINQQDGAIQQLTNDTRNCVDQNKQLNNQMKDVDALKSRIQYFFGLNNTINLVRRAIRGAIDTIKELDKAMTETAVVTDFSVGDMWKQLPDYTKRANELGVTTKAAYEAATLYYQQGLTTKEVTELSVETLKMARIAGLEAAEATDRMTNALRGFNMELNAANAQRVDDVYSRLAAISASNVDEISTAMTKVASLAHNTGAEFETTAAFLAQIIETTRESAETAGTALKTVFARFSEVKKLVDENELSGTDEEGEAINVNKVSEALRSAGIDLNRYFLGEVGLDDIFMELAQKWDNLTSLQQRYIATQAAGSRQQSRFIALMSDYARTQELVGEAYNANGASAKQFAKTQESLESKLARLKNAWNEFLMGLTNSTVVKAGVDLLTDLLNVINKLTSAFGEGAGSIMKWALALGALRGASSLFRTGGGIDALLTGNFGANLAGSLTGGTGVQGGAHLPKGTTVNKAPSVMANIGTGLWTGAKGIGSKLFGLGGAAGAEATGVAGMAAGLAGLGTALAAIAAAIGVIYTGYQAWLRLTPKGQIKFAENHAKSLEQVNSVLQKNTDEYKKATAEIKNYNNAVNNAQSVAEHNQAIKDRNEYITSLIKQNAEYARYVNYVKEDGEIVLTLDEDALQAAADAAAQAAAKAAADAAFGNANVSKQSAEYYESLLRNVDLEKGTIRSGSIDENGNTVEWERQLTEKELQLYQSYDAQMREALEQMENQAMQGVLELLGNSELPDTLATSIASLVSKGFGEVETDSISPFWWLRSKNYYQQEYERTTGQKADESLTSRQLAEAIVQAAQTNELNVRVTNIADIANASTNQEGFDRLLQTLNDTVNFSDKNLTLLDPEHEGQIFSELFGYETLGDLAPDITKLADAMEESTDALIADLKQRIKDQRKYQAQATTQNAANMYAQAQKADVNPTIMVDFLRQFFELSSFEVQQQVADLFTFVSETNLAKPLIENLTSAFKDGELDAEVANWIEHIDLRDPINGFAQLQEAAGSANESIAGIAQSILKDEQAMRQFSAANQLQALTMSDSYEDLEKELAKLIKKNGEITSTNIRDLAKESKELDQMLKNGQLSAKALAAALTALETGQVKMEDFNDGILAALNSMDDLDGMVKETIEDLNSFDPGFDENDITGFITKAYENAKDNLEKGAYGNNAMRGYMEKIFGNFEYYGPEEGYGNAYIAWLVQNMQWLEANKENMYNAWTDVASAIDAGMKGVGRCYEQNGEIILEAGGRTTDELVQLMVETTNLTETQARMMIADFKNYSADFAHEMAKNDLGNAIKAWADNARTAANGSIVYTDKELQTLASVLGVTVEEVKKTIQDLASSDTEGVKYRFRSMMDIDTSNADNLKNSLKELGYEFDVAQDKLKELGETKADVSQAIDVDSLKEACNNLQLEFEESLNTLVGDSQTFIATINGSATEITRTAGETAAEAYNRTVEQVTQADFAEAIGTAVAEAISKDGYEVKFVTNEGDVTLEISAIKEKAEELQGPFKMQISCPPDTAVSGLRDINNALLTVQQTALNTAAAVAAVGGSRSTGGNVSGISDAVSKRGGTFLGGHAAGGRVRSYGGGSSQTVPPGPALTGEEGPEIIWNKEKGYAYVTGEEHPEIQNLQPGDRIFTAKETKKILRGVAAGGWVPAFARGYGGATKYPKTGSGSGGSGSGSSGSSSSSSEKEPTKEEWRSTFDWLYNLLEDIVELEREQKELQNEQNRILQNDDATGIDLYENFVKQSANLLTQLAYQTKTNGLRQREMREFMDANSQYGDYFRYNWNDQTLEIDWDAINEIGDKETYETVEKLVSEAEKIQDKMDSSQDAIRDINDQMHQLEDMWRDSYVDFEKRVLDAVISSYQRVIDNYTDLNTTITETNNSILRSIETEISLQRQIRDNTQTEEDITDTESQLAYLRRDTTGANQSKILQMQQQLEDQRQSYSDTLIDQAIDKLQTDNQLAAEQRQKQIDLMQAQLDQQVKEGAFNDYIREIISTSISSDGTLATDSDLFKLLSSEENVAAMSETSKAVWEEELDNKFKEVTAFLLKTQSEADGSYLDQVAQAINDNVWMTVTTNTDGVNGTLENMANGMYGSFDTLGDRFLTGLNGVGTGLESGFSIMGTNLELGFNSIGDGLGGIGIGMEGIGTGIGSMSQAMDHVTYTYDDAVNGLREANAGLAGMAAENAGLRNAMDIMAQQQQQQQEDTWGLRTIGGSGYTVTKNGKDYVTANQGGTYSEVEKELKKLRGYSTGGLNIETGLAMLHGTPSEPEYVLNARQTDAFLRLADVLPSLMNGTYNTTNTTYGNSVFNINIDVDSISSDYDVDQLVTRIKDDLADAVSYRNVNSLSFIR